MKNIKLKFILPFVIIALIVGCDDFLEEKSKTSATADYLQASIDGLHSECVALYNIDRSILLQTETELFAILLDRGTDIDVHRGAGKGTAFYQYNTLMSTDPYVAAYWRHLYRMIGKTNEILEGAGKFDLNTISTDQAKHLKTSIGEAALFRARSYFQLLTRFDRINLDTVVVTAQNVDDIKFKPADPEDVLDLIYKDLDKAINSLEWSAPNEGRFTRGTAKHLKAKVAMWRNDYDEAAKQVDDIEAAGIYSLLPNPIEVFTGANLLHKEAIYTFQFSRERGGGGGHRMSLIYLPIYYNVPGFRRDLSLGGHAWGRVYPNTYLMSLYDQAKDKRYTQLFKHPHEWVYQFEDILPAGKKIGDEADVTNAAFLGSKHLSTLKYFDNWTQLVATETTAYKDVIIYRLAETYLLGAEAYMKKNGGNDAKALYYFNKTWMRAGNEEFTGTLTEDMILNEHARELHLEGSRFEILKRTGKLIERVRLYGGETKEEAITQDCTQSRTSIQEHNVRWPIPLEEIDQMGGSTVFPQNPEYN